MNSNHDDYKPRNYRTVRHVTRTSILVIEDCLRLGKLRVEIVSYQRGEGVRATVEHYLDTDVARLLFSELARGRLADPHQEFKGTMRDGHPCEGSQVDSASTVTSQGENRFTGNAIRNFRKGG